MTLEEPVFGPCRNSSCTFVPSFLGWTYGSVKTMAISAVNISLSFTTLNSVDLSCLENLSVWDFPGNPVVKTLPRHARIAGSSLVEELRSHMPCGQKKKKEKKRKGQNHSLEISLELSQEIRRSGNVLFRTLLV